MPVIASVFIGVCVGVLSSIVVYLYGSWEYDKGFKAGLGLRAAYDYRKEQEDIDNG